MLETLRKASKGWFAGVMILMLLGSFGIFWNVQDMLNFSGPPTIAEVGGEGISPDRFQREFSRFLRQMRQNNETEISSVQAKALGLDRVALDRMLTRLAMAQKSTDIGLKVSTAQILDELKSVRGLVNDKGQINPAMLRDILQNNDMVQEELFEAVGGDIQRQQLLRPLLSGLSLPAELEEALQRFRLERRVVEYIVVDTNSVGEIKDPSEAELKKYYETNADARYATPEYRNIVFVKAGSDDVAAKVKVTDDEIKKAYEANRRAYEVPEKRTIQQIKFKTEASARAAKTKLDAGAKFEDIAKAEGFKPEDINLGEVTSYDTTIPREAFSLEVNKISNPVKGAFGWFILRVLNITPGSLKTLDEVREEIRKRFVDERSKDLLFELTSELEDTLGGGATLEEAAKKHGLSTQSVVIDATGTDMNGLPLPNLPGGEFLSQVFAADLGTDPELLQSGDGVYYEFRIDKITPKTKKPFAGIKAQVLSDWRDEQLKTKIKAKADELASRGNKGEKLSALASALGLAPLTSEPLPRFGKTAAFTEEALTAIGETKKGKFFVVPVPFGNGRVVGAVVNVEYATDDPNSPLRSAYSEQLQAAFERDVAAQLEAGIRADVGAEINEQRFQQFHNNE